MGRRARRRPISVRRGPLRPRSGASSERAEAAPAGSMAPISVSSCRPERTWRESGASRKGKSSTAPSPRAAICRMTLASEVRRISGSVYSGRASKSACEYRRMAMPSATRPQRPARWLALARLIGSIGRRWTLVRLE